MHRHVSGDWAAVAIDADAYSIPYVGAGLADGQIWLGGTLGRLWRTQNSASISRCRRWIR